MEQASIAVTLKVTTQLILLGILLASATSVLASGSGHHHHDGETSAHMQSMLAVKNDIPDEYRIMERTPLYPSETSLQQGRELYMQNCSGCHGDEGNGKGPSASSLKIPPANFLDKKHSAIYGPGEKFWIIGNGTDETGMPAFSHLTPSERWHLVNFILHFQEEAEMAEK